MNMHQIIPQIILASQSKPRKELLNKLKIEFSVMPANIDESALPGENHIELVERLSKSKSEAIVSQLISNSLAQPAISDIKAYIIISSDQIAVFNNKIYGKPGDYNEAYTQLEQFNGQTIEFITGLCVKKITIQNSKLINEKTLYTYEPSKIQLRSISKQDLTNYIEKEQPLDCAASFKLEGLGISLIEKIECDDYNAIIGLPLIKLISLLKQMDINILEFP